MTHNTALPDLKRTQLQLLLMLARGEQEHDELTALSCLTGQCRPTSRDTLPRRPVGVGRDPLDPPGLEGSGTLRHRGRRKARRSDAC